MLPLIPEQTIVLGIIGKAAKIAEIDIHIGIAVEIEVFFIYRSYVFGQVY